MGWRRQPNWAGLGSSGPTGTGLRGRSAHQLVTKVDLGFCLDLGFCQNGTSHALLGQAVRAAAATPTRLGHPRFLDALRAQTADFNEVRSPKMPAILGIMWLNFLSVIKFNSDMV